MARCFYSVKCVDVCFTEDESGQVEAGSPAGVVAACATVVIFLTVVIALSVFILLW